MSESEELHIENGDSIFQIVVVSKKHSMQRSKAVWINFHGNQLSSQRNSIKSCKFVLFRRIYIVLCKCRKFWISCVWIDIALGLGHIYVGNGIKYLFPSLGADISIPGGGLLITAEANALPPSSCPAPDPALSHRIWKFFEGRISPNFYGFCAIKWVLLHRTLNLNLVTSPPM